MKDDIQTVKSFLDITIKYVLSFESLFQEVEEYWKEHQTNVDDLFIQGKQKELKRYGKYLIENMTDNPDYLALVNDYQFLYPKLLSGNKKVLKRLLNKDHIINRTDYEITKSQITFIGNPLLLEFNPSELEKLERLIFDFEFKKS